MHFNAGGAGHESENTQAEHVEVCEGVQEPHGMHIDEEDAVSSQRGVSSQFVEIPEDVGCVVDVKT